MEWQCFDENHNRGNTHILHNIIEFRVNIYAAQKMRPGGSWFPLPKRIQETKAVINPKNKDDRCFLYAVFLGLLDLSKIKNSVRVSQIKKGVTDQKVTVNCSLPMPVEPVPANFRKFEADNPCILLNVYGTLGVESRSPVTPLYVSNNKDKDAKIVR